MESFNYPHFPSRLSSAHISLFVDVKNASELRRRIIAAASMSGEEGEEERKRVNFAFIEARLVTSRRHLSTALYQSMLAETHGVLKTKTVHSEIIWALNPTNNITEALRRFGVSDASTALFVVRVGPCTNADAVEKQMQAIVDGSVVPLGNLEEITDWTAVKKYYKVNADPAVVSVSGDRVVQNAIVDELVTSFVAMKSVMS